MSEPNLINIKKWIAALRSGKYTQGKAVLKSTEGEMCCLGVATDLYIKEHDFEWGPPVQIEGITPRMGCTFDTEGEYLPVPVQEWLGIDTKNPELESLQTNDDDVRLFDEATYFNDESGLSFEDIADAIENTYITGGEHA